MAVELVYFRDCPNVPAAREQLRRAFDALHLAPDWSEHDVASEDAPARVRGFGSPTILVDGRDVSGASPAGGASCRVYPGSDVRGVPPLDAIVAALRGSAPVPARGWIGAMAVVPGALLSALPVVACPSCWPAYAGVLSALGVPFLMRATWLLPSTVLALAAAVGSLAFRARARRGFGPFVLGALAAAAILIGKFAIERDAAVYVGTALLVGASVWNGWPKAAAPACATCEHTHVS